MSNTEKGLFWLCVILTMAMAFTAMMISLPRVCDIHSNINFDYQTMIVTILGIFVTALIGWQIWQTMISRREVERADQAAQRIAELETTLNIRSEVFTQRNMEITHLIDAHTWVRSAQNTNSDSLAYSHLARALNSFIRSNVAFNYHPLQECIRDIADTLIHLEHEGNDDDKQDFIESSDVYEQLYNDIIASIHQRQQDIEELHRLVVGMRDDRIALRDRLINPQPPTPEY